MQEIIQNAEDARASRIIFLLDHTTYPARDGKLHHPDLTQHQVPTAAFVSAYPDLPSPLSHALMLLQLVTNKLNRYHSLKTILIFLSKS